MDSISLFLNEMRRSEWHDNIPFKQRKYNDVFVGESAQSYSEKIAPIYISAVVALLQVPTDKFQILQSLIGEVEKCQENFLVPSDETIDAIMRDYNQGNHQDSVLKERYDYLCFVRDCMKMQMVLLEKFKNKFPNTNKEEKTEITTPIRHINPIKGVKGLASYLDVGTTKAQDILNSGVLQKNGIAFRVGRQWNINPKRLDELMTNHPTVLYKRNR